MPKKRSRFQQRNLCSDPGLGWATQGHPIMPLLRGSEVAFETWAQKAFPNRERQAFPNRERIPVHLYQIFLNLVPPFPYTLLRKSAIGICSRTRTRPCCPLQLRPQAPAHTLALVWVCTPTPRGRTVSGSCLCSSYCCSMDSVLGATPCLRFSWLVHCTPCHCSTTTTTNKPRPLDTNFNRTHKQEHMPMQTLR